MNKNTHSTFGAGCAVFELFNRIALLPMLLITVGSVLLQSVAFWAVCVVTRNNDTGILDAFEVALEGHGIPILAGVGFIGISWIFTRMGSNAASKSAYTLCRLSISEKTIVFLQSLYGALGYFLYWMAQLGAVLLMYQIYVHVFGASAVTSQSFALAFWRGTYLHGLLPLSEPFSVALNFFITAELGFATACHGFHQRRGKKQSSKVWLMIFWTGLYFPRHPGLQDRSVILGMDYRSVVLAILLLCFVLFDLYAISNDDSDEEEIT